MPNKKSNENNQIEYLPARMLNEYVYCPRLFYLEMSDNEFEDSDNTIDGRFKHERVDNKKLSKLNNHQIDEGIKATAITLSGDKCGIIAKMDLLEIGKNEVVPVEYKRGSLPLTNENVWDTDKIQLCAQAMVLKENRYNCNSGIVYYVESKTRVKVEFSKELFEQVLNISKDAKKLLEDNKIPPPLIDSKKCNKCSLVGICLPDETNTLLNRSSNKDRRIIPSLDSSLPLYVQEQGLTVTKKNENLNIINRNEQIKSIPLIKISQLDIFGNIQVTTQAIKELSNRNIPICYFSYGGWFYAITNSMSHKNINLRIKQFSIADDPKKSIEIAKSIIYGKIKNSKVFLKRNSFGDIKLGLSELDKSLKQVKKAKTSDILLGIEGNAARIYFMSFNKMLKHNDKLFSLNFHERNRRPPSDPVNALLSYTYALMVKDFTVTLLSVGFDPYRGFYHAPKYGKPALALDLMEEFRPIIADSVVITMINNKQLSDEDFIKIGNSVSLKPNARKKVLIAYEHRLDTNIVHPIFKYKISYRRVIEVQARLLAKYIQGEIPDYTPFYVR